MSFELNYASTEYQSRRLGWNTWSHGFNVWVRDAPKEQHKIAWWVNVLGLCPPRNTRGDLSPSDDRWKTVLRFSKALELLRKVTAIDCPSIRLRLRRVRFLVRRGIEEVEKKAQELKASPLEEKALMGRVQAWGLGHELTRSSGYLPGSLS